MPKTHYETLGLKRSATPAEVRSAYRKLALVHHPDRSKDVRSPAIFLSATEAYEVLSDASARTRYDELLDLEAKRAEDIRREKQRMVEQAAVAAAQATTAAGPRPGWTAPRTEAPPNDARRVAEDILRLTTLFARGSHAEAECLARQITEVAPRNPAPYAVLGDIARLHGNINEAAKMYAYAAQFEPTNRVYQRRYEELLASTKVVEDRRQTTTLAQSDRNVLAPMAACGLVLIAALYVGFSSEAAFFGKLPFVGTWTLGLVVVLFLSGIGVGASLAAGNLLDRFQAVATTAAGRAGPAVTLALVALVNFWAAVTLYLMLGLFHRAWNFSMSRLLAGVASDLLMLTLACAAGHGHIAPGQTLLWGGNIVYLGALLGWLVADSFRP